MTISAENLRKLSALRLDPDQMSGVLDILADMQTVDEARKEAQRLRVRRHRALKRDSNVTETAHEYYTPIPDKEKSPEPPKEINPTPDPSSLRSEARAPAKATKPFRMPDDFHPDIEFAVSEGLSRSEALSEAEKIRDWSKSSPNGKKLDWPATWRGWVRRKLEDRTPPRSTSPPRLSAHQQRHQTAIDSIDQKFGLKQNDEPTSYDFDLAPGDWRAH